MERAELFSSGGRQAVRLPEDFRFPGGEVLLHRVGDMVILLPRTASGAEAAARLFTEDFMEDGRNGFPAQERETP